MNVVIYSSNDWIAKQGFTHFISLYGLNLHSPEETLRIVEEQSNVGWEHAPIGHILLENRNITIIGEPIDLTNQGTPVVMYRNQEKEYPCVVETPQEIRIGIDIFSQIGLFLSGRWEKLSQREEIEGEEIAQTPFVDHLGFFLFQEIKKAHLKNGEPFIHKSLWPEGKGFAVCLTHDVDEVKKTYQWLTYPVRYLKRLEIKRFLRQFISLKEKLFGREPFWTFDRIISMEKELGVRSTFFFLHERSAVNIFNKKTWRHWGRRYDLNEERLRYLLKELQDMGWEIGLHGSFYSYLQFQQLLDEKQYLERVLGQGIYGCRQHNLNLSIPETWIYQENAGIKYDTTLGFNHRVGFRWGTCFPFQPYDVHGRRWINILEIPLIIEDLPFFSIPRTFSEDIITEVKNRGGILTLLWHHTVFNDNEFPGWGDRYKDIIRVCQKENAWIVPGCDIYHWWVARREMEFDWRYDGSSLTIEFSGNPGLAYFDLHLPIGREIKKIENGEILNAQKNLVVIKSNPKSTAIHLNFQ